TTFHLDSSVDRAAPGARDAIRAAASAWSGLDGAPAITIADDGGGDAPGFDGKSTIFYARDGSELAGGALAVTLLTYDDSGSGPVGGGATLSPRRPRSDGAYAALALLAVVAFNCRCRRAPGRCTCSTGPSRRGAWCSPRCSPRS